MHVEKTVDSDGSDYSLEKTISVCEGVVLKIDRGNQVYESRFKSSYDKGKQTCLFLDIKTNDGLEKIVFAGVPGIRMSIIERDALIRRTVRYKQVHSIHYDFRVACESWSYSLEIIKGKYTGFRFEGSISYSPPIVGGP